MNNNLVLTGQIGELVFEMPFQLVKDKPGYYWLSKRNYQIISEETLKKAINEYDKNLYKLFLYD